MSNIFIKPREDEIGISIETENDIIDITPEQTEKLIETMKKRLAESKKLGAPIPKLFLSGHDANDPFAVWYPHSKGITPAGTMGGFELYEKNLDQIISWCQRCKEYIKKHVSE